MTEERARRHLIKMLRSFTPGTVLDLLGQVLRESEEARLGGLDKLVEERVHEARAALIVFGIGLDAVCPRG